VKCIPGDPFTVPNILYLKFDYGCGKINRIYGKICKRQKSPASTTGIVSEGENNEAMHCADSLGNISGDFDLRWFLHGTR
jgi:hypothetical protein